jgi:dihydrofolate reductase
MTSTHGSLDSALSALDASTHRAFLIGGAQLYNMAFQHVTVDRVLLTRVLTEFPCDTFLHDFTHDGWKQSTHGELCEWVGWDVPAGEQVEKGVRYQYEMWVRS